MASNNFIEVKNNIITIKGDVNFSNVIALQQQGIALINTMADIKISLKELSHCDSSGLALLTAWIRLAKVQKKPITLVHVPSFMQDIVRVYGLDSVLPVLWEN